jgi:hypothetical protein
VAVAVAVRTMMMVVVMVMVVLDVEIGGCHRGDHWGRGGKGLDRKDLCRVSGEGTVKSWRVACHAYTHGRR